MEKPTDKTGLPAELDDRAHFYTEASLGAIYARERTLFRVFAPLATSVSVVLYAGATGPDGRREIPMHLAGKGVWEAAVAEDLAGVFYLYRFHGHVVKPDIEVVDIYATNTVESTTRARITPPGSTNPPAWDEFKDGPPLRAPTDAILYEAHIRDLTMSPSSGVDQKGLYLGWIQGGTHLPDDPEVKTALDHIEELGVTHVQLLPVQDFELDERGAPYFWGYMTNAFNSPEGMYASEPGDESRVRELKALIAALHARGIGVVLDVVYNHVGNGATFDHHVPDYYFRRYPNGKRSNGSGCGNDFRSEAPMARKFIVDSLKHWLVEYGVDGFRFDLMALLDVGTMAEVGRELREIRPDVLLYGEPWSAGDSALVGRWTDKAALQDLPGVGAFNDDFRNVVKGSPSGAEAAFIQTGHFRDAVLEGIKGQPNWAPQPSQAINYISCHDNLTLWDKLVHSCPTAGDEDLVRMAKLGYFLILVAQGVPLLHAGCEFGRSKGGDENSYRAPDSVNAIDWSLKKKHAALYRYVRDLIQLRRQHPIFRLRSHTEIQQRMAFYHHDWHDVLVVTLRGDGLEDETWSEVCLLANGSPDKSSDVHLPVGPWMRACDGRGCIVHSKVWEGTVAVPPRTGMVFFRK